MRERERRLVLEDREFILRKMPAAKGYAILAETLTKALPLNIIGSALEDFVPKALLNLDNKQQMSMAELEQLQLRLLSSVSEQLPGGVTAIVDSKGHFQVEDLEDDMLLFGQLLIKVLEFQYKDFFLEILAKLGITLEEPGDLLKKFAATPNECPTSANTSLPPLSPDTGDSTNYGMALTQ